MPEAIYFRIIGNTATLSLHGVNSLVMLRSMQDQNIMKDPEVNTMVSMQATYLTVWNIFFQLLYSLIALSCDVSTIISREDLVPKSLRKFRQTLFESAVFPVTLVIFIFFWPIFLYDREIIFPEFIDKIFSFKSNMAMHFWILPVVLWEIALLPKTMPKSHKVNVGIITLYYFAYNAVMFSTYYRRGLWPYPLLKSLYGTIYFSILVIFMYLLSLFMYYIQWPLKAHFMETEKLKNK